MHGKSTATAFLGWSNDLVDLPDFHRLPFPLELAEHEILARLQDTLARRSISAVFLEPLQGSSGGHMASRHFCKQVSQLCAEYGSLFVVDEIFTGFYRTGQAFLHQELQITPDIVLIGKTMGNGFPVSGVVAKRTFRVESTMLPGSTYAGNPLAASAVSATLAQMRNTDLAAKVASIEQTIKDSLGDLRATGIALRGKGALWVLEFPSSTCVQEVARHIIQRGVLVSPTGNYIRLLPPATISPARLTQACAVIREVCLESSTDNAIQS